MASSSLRTEVLNCYRQILRTRSRVFSGDLEALSVVQKRARQEFEKRKNLTTEEQIRESLKIGWDSIEILQRTVIQGRLNQRGNYEMDIKNQNLDN